MNDDYAILPHVALAPGSKAMRPARTRHTPLDAPATEVMTDFMIVWPVTVTAEVPIDTALERMKRAGVRMLLVVDDGQRVVGLVTAADIQGERPVQLGREDGLPRGDITVGQILTPQSDIEVLSMASVTNARVGHVVATLHALERQHALVVETAADGTSHIRGLFSTSEVGKRIGRDLNEVMASAHSLAELRQVRSSAG